MSARCPGAWPRPERGPLPGRLAVLLGLLLLLLPGCMHYLAIRDADGPALYLPDDGSEPTARHAPVFLVHNPEAEDNRIGSPRAARGPHGDIDVRMETATPAVYCLESPFATPRGRYTNLIYRVHFPGTPASLVPFFLGAGRNMGLLVVVTLDARERPVLVTTLGTCGCYVACVPTDELDLCALPADWSATRLEVYGETLPGLLAVRGLAKPRLLVEIRPGEHRVMGLRMVETDSLACLGAGTVATRLAPMAELERLPLDGEKGTTVSLFYPDGPAAGHVRGAWKPWETLLLGPISLDPLVGMDKAYADPAVPLYTSLKPWNRRSSDLNDFPGFLRHSGWRL